MVHKSTKCFFCSVCDKSFSTKQALNNHLSEEHNTLDKKTINDQVDSISPAVKSLFCIYIFILKYIFISFIYNS
jgi:hypothetical protein